METSPSSGNRYPSHWQVLGEDADGEGNPLVRVAGALYLVKGGQAYELEQTDEGLKPTNKVVSTQSLIQDPQRQAPPASQPRPATQQQPRNSDGTFAARTGGKRMERPRVLSGNYYAERTGPHNIKRGWRIAGAGVGVATLLSIGAGAIAFDGERAAEGVGQGAELAGGLTGAAAGGAVNGARELAGGAADGAGLDFQSPVAFEDSAEGVQNGGAPQNTNTAPQPTVPTFGGPETTVPVAPQPEAPVVPAAGSEYVTGFGGQVIVTDFDGANPTAGFGTPRLVAAECARQAGLVVSGAQAEAIYNGALVPINPSIQDGLHAGDVVNC